MEASGFVPVCDEVIDDGLKELRECPFLDGLTREQLLDRVERVEGIVQEQLNVLSGCRQRLQDGREESEKPDSLSLGKIEAADLADEILRLVKPFWVFADLLHEWAGPGDDDQIEEIWAVLHSLAQAAEVQARDIGERLVGKA